MSACTQRDHARHDTGGSGKGTEVDMPEQRHPHHASDQRQKRQAQACVADIRTPALAPRRWQVRDNNVQLTVGLRGISLT